MLFTVAGIARRAAKREPMESLNTSFITRAAGVVGDSRGKPSARQVTVLSMQSWMDVCAAHGAPLNWLIRRANLCLNGRPFTPQDIGQLITIGAVVLQITKECDPCYRMDEQIPHLQNHLKPAFTAGVCCKVLSDGLVHIGDAAIISAPPTQHALF